MLSLANICVGARDSLLSRKQIEEVLAELRDSHPEIQFETCLLQTVGDKDLQTSLRSLGKTDFFTKEIDELLLQGKCRIAIHSAKDLPDPLPAGLKIVVLTKGVDSSDSLVHNKRELSQIKKVGSSSARRDEVVREILPWAEGKDIRGTIQSRLEQLDRGDYDAVVIAEAALIRLGLTERQRITLPGATTPLQGRLAVVAREGDEEMIELFGIIHHS